MLNLATLNFWVVQLTNIDIMKIFISILFCFIALFFCGCKVLKHNQKIMKKYDCEILTTKFIDSLQKENIDTILYFSNKCIGCINSNTETNYIFWKKSNETKVLKIDSYLGKQEVKESNDIFKFYAIDSIRNESLSKPKFELSHYHFYRLKQLSKNSFEVDIPDYYLEVNNDKSISNLIYRIESILYRLKI